MNRQPQPGDDPVQVTLDGAFLGVDCRRTEDLTESAPGPGMVVDAVNMRFSNGEAETRNGAFDPVPHNMTEAGTIYGAGVHAEPDGRERLVRAAAGSTVHCADGAGPYSVLLPAGVTITGRVRFVQSLTTLFCLRGPSADPLIWRGDRFARWVAVDQELDPARPEFIRSLPRCAWAVPMADRLFVPVSRNEIAWSDLLDPNRYDLSENTVRLSQGEDDSIVYAAPYQGNRLVVFKTRSIWFLGGVGGDMSGISLDRLPGQIGCVSLDTVTAVGGELFWLGNDGLYSLGQTVQGELRGVPTPLSEPVAPWFRRVNWAAASGACATLAGRLFYLAVPMDGSSHNNAVLVYDVVSQRWQGMDTYGTEAILALVTSWMFGQITAFLVTATRVTALGHGDVDREGGTERPIISELTTRGYMAGDARDKRVTGLALSYAALDATVSLDLVTDGVREVTPVMAGSHPDRRRYTRHGRADFLRTNENDDFARAYRNDYAWKADDLIQLRSGVPLRLLQQWTRTTKVSRSTRAVALRIRSTTGRLRVNATLAEVSPGRGGGEAKQ